MRRIARVLLVLAMSSTACGGKNWVSAKPRAVSIASADTHPVDEIVAVARSLGYHIQQEDRERGFVQVRAHLDGDVYVNNQIMSIDEYEASQMLFLGTPNILKRVSYFNLQVQDDKVQLTATGYHVDHDKNLMHKKLFKEMTSIAKNLKSRMGVTAQTGS